MKKADKKLNKTILSIKSETKEKLKEVMISLNSGRSKGRRLTPNDWVEFFIDHATSSQLESLRQSKLSIFDHELKVRLLYEQEHSSVSDEDWEMLKISGKLYSFFKRHSAIPSLNKKD